jgi:leucine-rich repeat protein SHOC2
MRRHILDETIYTARVDKISELDLSGEYTTSIPKSIGYLTDLKKLDLSYSKIKNLPKSIGDLRNLTHLYLKDTQLTKLPNSISNLNNLTKLRISDCSLTSLPNSISDLINSTFLDLGGSKLTDIPENINKLVNLNYFDLDSNQLSSIPDSVFSLCNLGAISVGGNQLTYLTDSITNLSSLTYIYLNHNPLTDLSILKELSKLKQVIFLFVDLPRKYWTKLSDWNPKWLLDEKNSEIRQVLIQQIGYDRICQELNAIDLDTWREYTLLKIEVNIDEEPMVLLKMICPSTGHIYILRVPPEITSAEAAITWVNHGIHPDEFSVQT